MVGVAQLVEPRIVIPVVVGSSPIVHPTNADVAELVDALDLGSSAERCGSSSLPVRTIKSNRFMHYILDLIKTYFPYLFIPLFQIFLFYLWHGRPFLRQNEKNYLKTLVHLDKQKQYIDYDVLSELIERVKFRYYVKLLGNHFLNISGYQKISEYISKYCIAPSIIKISIIKNNNNSLTINLIAMRWKITGYSILAFSCFYLLMKFTQFSTSFYSFRSYLIWVLMLMYFLSMQYCIIKIRDISDAIRLVPMLLGNIQLDTFDTAPYQKLSPNIIKARLLYGLLIVLLFGGFTIFGAYRFE